MAIGNPGIETLEDLVATVETRERLDDFVERCEMGIWRGRDLRKLKKSANDRMRQITAAY